VFIEIKLVQWGRTSECGEYSNPELLAELAHEAQEEGWNGVCTEFLMRF
jgi:hypothetical protein